MKAIAQIQNLNYKMSLLQGAVKGKTAKKAKDNKSGKGLSKRKIAEITQMLGSEKAVEDLQTSEPAEVMQEGVLFESNASESSSVADKMETGCMFLRGEPVNLRQAILAAEILGEPVSKKRRAGRRHGY